MKYIKYTITLLAMFLSLQSFAATVAQKEAYINIMKSPENVVNGKDSFNTFVVKNKDIIKLIYDWALIEPTDANTFLSDIKISNVRNALNVYRIKLDNKKELTPLQGLVINSGLSFVGKVRKDISVYNELKQNNFEIETVAFGELVIGMLALTANDLPTFESLNMGAQANLFDKYIVELEKHCATLSPKEAWEKFVETRKKFTPYQNEPKVKANWARLKGDEDDAFVDYQRTK